MIIRLLIDDGGELTIDWNGAAKESNEEYLHVPTIGIDGESIVDMEYKSEQGGGVVKLRVELVDFAGQVEYYIGHQIFLSDIQCLYVVMAEYGRAEEGMSGWLSFLKSMVSSGSRIPVMMVCSKAPLGAAAAAAAGDEQWMKQWSPPFELGDDGMVLYKLEDGKEEEDNRVGPSGMREMVRRRLKGISESSRVPGMYCRAMDGVLEWVKERAASGEGGKIVGRRELEERIKKMDDRLDKDPGLLLRAVRYMKGGGMISYSSEQSEWVVLEPLSWLPRLLALFVGSEEALHIGSPISVDEFGVVDLSDISYEVLMSRLSLSSRGEADGVLELMGSYGMAHRDDRDGSRLFVPMALKATADWRLKSEELGGGRVLCREWRCIGGRAFPPGFFSQLQIAVVRRMRNPQYPKHCNVLYGGDDGKNSVQVVLEWERKQRVMMVVWGPSPLALFVAMFNLIEHLIGSYSGLSGAECVERWSMCPVGLYDGCEAKVNPCCMKLSRREGGYSEWNDLLAQLANVRLSSLFKSNPPPSSFSSSAVSEWSVSNGLEHYHDELIGSRALLYEGCEWIVDDDDWSVDLISLLCGDSVCRNK